MYPPFGPILFQLGPFSLHWYGLILMTGILVGTFVASRYVGRHGQDPNSVWDLLLWLLIPAILGARLYFVFIQSPWTPYGAPNGVGHYLANPIEILEVWRGGIHIYGGLIFGAITLLIYMRVRKLPLLVYLDAIGLGLLIGQAIGRNANFINQELYGPPTTLPWGLRIDDQHRVPPYNDLTQYPESVRFQPLFLYETLWNFIGFGLIFWISRRFEKQLRAGDIVLLYLIWYPSGRFMLEFFRTDSWFFPGTPFNLVHLLSAIVVIGSAIILFLRHRPGRAAVEVAGVGVTTVSDSDIFENETVEVTETASAETLAVEVDRSEVSETTLAEAITNEEEVAQVEAGEAESIVTEQTQEVASVTEETEETTVQSTAIRGEAEAPELSSIEEKIVTSQVEEIDEKTIISNGATHIVSEGAILEEVQAKNEISEETTVEASVAKDDDSTDTIMKKPRKRTKKD